MNEMDLVRLNFNPGSLWALNAIIGLVMFGVALDLKLADFKAVLTMPRPVLIGMAGQFVLLPAFTFLLVLAIQPAPSIALGMMLVAACPGGNISNFLTHYAKGNTALSITMTALSTAVAIVMTPLNLSLWGGLNPDTAKILKVVALDPLDMLLAVFLLLGLPMIVGMWAGHRFPVFVERAHKPVKIFSIGVFRPVRGRRAGGQLALLSSTTSASSSSRCSCTTAWPCSPAISRRSSAACPSATGARCRSRSASRTRRWA
jgi:BASS family bile acid:Na+ symporter